MRVSIRIDVPHAMADWSRWRLKQQPPKSAECSSSAGLIVTLSQVMRLGENGEALFNMRYPQPSPIYALVGFVPGY